MENDYPKHYLEKLYRHHFFHKWNGWREEIFQIMWKALFEANIRYRRYRCRYSFEDYAEAVIVKNSQQLDETESPLLLQVFIIR